MTFNPVPFFLAALLVGAVWLMAGSYAAGVAMLIAFVVILLATAFL